MGACGLYMSPTIKYRSHKINIIIKEDYEKLVSPMSQKEYEELKESIKEQRKNMIPVIISQDDVLLDGHYRLKACTELGIKVEYQVMKFTDPLEV